MNIGFKRNELRARYDVENIHEDEWHSYSGKKTSEFLNRYLSFSTTNSKWLLNAGAGIYEIQFDKCKEVLVDLFTTPIRNKKYAVCASVENLPFKSDAFAGIVCVGEVLAYCDPTAAINEFARILEQAGVLIFDFGSSRSIRYWLKKPYGRAADLVTDFYNGKPEKTWIYDPAYIESLLQSYGLKIIARFGIHTWSALARRIGAPTPLAMFIQRHLEWAHLPSNWADVTTIVASRT